MVPTQSPTAEQEEKADQGGSNHRSGRGEDPMIERSFFGQLFGLLGHGGQFVKENLGVESSRDSCPELGDG